LKKLILVFALACSSLAVADPTPALPPSESQVARARRDRRIGIGLLIGAGAFAALGIVFVGLAKNANDGILTNQTYHPDAQDRRDHFQATDTAFFIAAGLTFASGMVFTFGR
jgi:hypothetical protein